MRTALVERFRCPVCQESPLKHQAFEAEHDDEITTGVLWCEGCGTWFPVEDGILELVHGSLAYPEDRNRFAMSHRGAILQLGLEPDPASVETQSSDLVSRQQKHFDWYADNEEQTYTAYEAKPFWRALDEIVFSEWRQEIRPGARLLDIACAQGRSTAPWIDLDLEILAFDISKPLVRQARDRCRAIPSKARVDFFVADASRLPFRSESFDYVAAYGVLHHLSDPAESCGEVTRLLRPGGTFFACENNKTAFRRAFDFLQSIWPIWHEEAGAEPLISDADLRRWSNPCGLTIATRTSVFLPPHLLNLLGKRMAEVLIRFTDSVFAQIPVLKDQGGLILVKGVKTQEPEHEKAELSASQPPLVESSTAVAHDAGPPKQAWKD